jgi:hypothetical protein
MPLAALVATLLPLLWVKRWTTLRLQELSWRWVGDPDVALYLYFVIVLPGIVLHELSHWLIAWLLGARIRRLSIGPVRKGRSRKVSLGSVQIANVDPIRAGLIGLAPLVSGSAVILLIGNQVLGVSEFAEVVALQGVGAILDELQRVVRVADVGLWLYLIFAVSNGMIPSESDMATVRPVLIFLGIVAAVVLVVGGVPAIPAEIARWVNAVAGFLASAFALTLAADGAFVLLIMLLTWLTRRLQGE